MLISGTVYTQRANGCIMKRCMKRSAANAVRTAAKSLLQGTLHPILLPLHLKPMLDSEGAKQRLGKEPRLCQRGNGMPSSSVALQPLCGLAIDGSLGSRLPFRCPTGAVAYWHRLHSRAQSRLTQRLKRMVSVLSWLSFQAACDFVLWPLFRLALIRAAIQALISDSTQPTERTPSATGEGNRPAAIQL